MILLYRICNRNNMRKDIRKSLIESEATKRNYKKSKYSDWVEEILSFAHGNILDMGSGDGAFTTPLVLKGNEVISADLSHLRLNGIRGINPKLVECDALILPFSDNSFDTILFIEVLEHLPNTQAQEETLKEFIRVLKPAGRLILTTPNRPVYKRIVKLWSWFGGQSPDPTHYTELSLSELVDLFSKHFKIIQVRGKIGFIPLKKIQKYFNRYPRVCYDILMVGEPK